MLTVLAISMPDTGSVTFKKSTSTQTTDFNIPKPSQPLNSNPSSTTHTKD